MTGLTSALCALLLGGCSGEGPLPGSSGAVAQPPQGGDADLALVGELPPPQAAGQDDVVSVGDQIQVDVYGMDKLSRTVEVDSNGAIMMPLVNQIHAAGLSLQGLQRAVAAAYGKYLRDPSVTLTIKDSQARRVSVDGQVNRPGIYPVIGRSTLSEAIAQAGGFNTVADQGKVFVYRVAHGKHYVANYNMEEIRASARPDPKIYGSDKVVVFSSTSRVAWSNVKDVMGFGAGTVGTAAVLVK